MNVIIESYTIVLELMLTFYFFQKMFPQIHSNLTKTIVVYISQFIVFLLYTLYLPVLLRTLIGFGFYFLCYHFYLKRPALKVVYTILLFYITMIFADLISGALLSLFGIDPGDMLGSGTGRFLFNTASKLIHFVFLVLIGAFMRRRYDSRSLVYAIPLLSCIVVSFLALYFQFTNFVESHNFIPFIVTTASLLLINIVICIYTESARSFYELKERQRFMNERLKDQERYYQDMIARQEETRALWHDMKKYMLAMEALVRENDRTLAEETLASLKGNFDRLSNTVNTGNPMIDGIFNYGMQKASAAHIPLELDLWVDPVLKFPIVDCYIILGNTMDNAIEACSAIPTSDSPSIQCSLRQKNHILFYEITNPIPDDAHKKDDTVHGYGLENVKACVQRNEGSITVNTENGIFCVQIILNV